jgi:phytoene dehydrogenase-like protein
MSPDVIVVGGGHNGLVAACYLARAGREVVVLEARATVGGCASTVEAAPGVRVNICSCDHSMVRGSGIIEELDLAAHGLTYLDSDPAQLSFAVGHAPWWTYFEVERTVEGLAGPLPAEARAYERYIADALPMARFLRGLANTPLSFGRGLRQAAGAGSGVARRILAWGRSSPLAILRCYFSSDAVIAPALVIGPSVWGVAPDTPGTGLAALTLAFRHVEQLGRPVGGSGALTDALAAALALAGGTIRTGCFVDDVCHESGVVTGVRLAGGEVVAAPVVVAAVAPQRLGYVSRTAAPRRTEACVERWAGAAKPDGYESKVDLVVSEPPRLRGVAYEEVGEISRALAASTVIAPAATGIAEAHAAWKSGRVHPAPLLYFNSPSAADPSMRTASGRHLLSIEVLFTPYELEGGWESSSEPERWIERFARFVEPGFLDTVDSYTVMTPPRYEREFFLERGHVPSFPGGPVAALVGRRHRALSRHATPIGGLFLAGGATFPGAGVWGASGRNAATVVLGSHRAPAWAS